MAEAEQHPEKEEIIRQVEFYLGDENLPNDAHLLALAGGDGNGQVELKKILNFPKMRRFKPKLQVKAALRDSLLLEIIDDKYIRRREPLEVPLRVEPKLDPPNPGQIVVPADKPWLTKGMLKKTGFEAGHVDGPITPAEHTLEEELYALENSFISRIEEATNRFCRNRKMHATTRNIFVKFMRFGGIVGGHGQFNSAANRKQLIKEGCDEDQVDRMTAYFSVESTVLEGFDEIESDSGAWYVDFAQIARGFLSSHFLQHFPWEDGDLIPTTCNILRNYYNYLLYHRVCPEFEDQIREAQEVCHLAEIELPRLIYVEKGFPGEFNVACSTLFGGCYKNLHRSSDATWSKDIDHVSLGFSARDAADVVRTGVCAYGTQIQKSDIACNLCHDGRIKDGLSVAWEQNVGLAVLELVPVTEATAALYEKDLASGIRMKPAGRLICKPWHIPYEPSEHHPFQIPVDRSQWEFILEQDILDYCLVGMKLDVSVKQLENGICWIDQLHAAHPTYFTWLQNELVLQPPEKDPWSHKEAAEGLGGDDTADTFDADSSNGMSASQTESEYLEAELASLKT